jgi:hypothetical protein
VRAIGESTMNPSPRATGTGLARSVAKVGLAVRDSLAGARGVCRREVRRSRRRDGRVRWDLVAVFLVAGLAVGAAGGRIERVGVATVLAALVLVVAVVQLIVLWFL